MAITLYLLRHGQTLCTTEERFCSRHDPSLSPAGMAMAQCLANYYAPSPWGAICTSPLLRARQTAEIINTSQGHPVIIDEDLRELDYGVWDHQPKAAIVGTAAYGIWKNTPDTIAPPGGETASQVALRAAQAVERARARYPAMDLLFITHKATIRILVCHYLGIAVRQFKDRIDSPVASLTCLRFDHNGPILTRLADVAHLPKAWRHDPDAVVDTTR